MEAGVAGTRHFQIYVRTDRLTTRQIVGYFGDIAIHPHVEMARRCNQALMYCCKEEPRISDNYYTNIPKEITPPVIPKLVTCERKLDSGGAVQSLLFPSWVSHIRSLNLYKNLKIAPRMNKSICIYLYWQPGTVKSEFALDLSRQIYQLEIAFYKAKCIWWDLYDYQNAVIWDDFMGDCCGPQNCLSYVIGILITFKLMQ